MNLIVVTEYMGCVSGVGAFALRWQSLRVAALRTCAAYWAAARAAQAPEPDARPDVRLVAAGLEPQRFTALFDTWLDHDQAADANINVSTFELCFPGTSDSYTLLYSK